MRPTPQPVRTHRTVTAPPTTSPGRPRVGRRRLLTLAAGMTLATGGIVAVGGGPASAIVDQHPWQVALVDRDGQFCGGSLVSEQIVLTAAHCVVGLDVDDIQVR